MASSFGPWADLPRELLRIIGDIPGLPLQSYCAIRRVCTAWRTALRPPLFPLLLTASSVAAPPPTLHGQVEAGARVSAHLLAPTGRVFPLSTLSVGGELIGCCNGWIAVDTVFPGIFLINPLAGEGREIRLHPFQSIVDAAVQKIVFAPDPTPDDHTAVAICGPSRIAYTNTRDMRKWITVDVAVEPPDRLAELAYDAGDGTGKVYCVTRCGDVHVFQIPGDRRWKPPTAQPLQQRRAGQAFSPAAAFTPPYDVASQVRVTGSKHVFVCDGGLYQVWRRDAGCGISWTMPGGGLFRMAKYEFVVLRYQAKKRRPCRDAVSDLGGWSVFVGRNNPVVLRPEDAPGVRANCVYWINEQSRSSVPMVFDMATRTSTPVVSTKELGPACKSLCWYFLKEKAVSVDES